MRVWEMVEALLATGPERCTVCDTPFLHGDGVYGGLLKGKPEVVGDCCLEGLTKVLSFGLCETESAMTALAAAEEEAAE